MLLILKYSVQQLQREEKKSTFQPFRPTKSRRSTTWFMNSATEPDGTVDRGGMTYELQNYCLFCCMMAQLCDSLHPRTSSSPASIFNPQTHTRACMFLCICVCVCSCVPANQWDIWIKDGPETRHRSSLLNYITTRRDPQELQKTETRGRRGGEDIY